MSNKKLAIKLRDQEVAQEIAQREGDMIKAGEKFESAMLLERSLGIKKVSFKELPEDWSVTKREHLIWRSRLFKDVPEEEFIKWLKTARRAENFRPGSIRNKADRYRADKEREARLLEPLGIEGVELYTADISVVSKLRLGKATAVITDPPYEEKALNLWTELMFFSGRVLQEHGWLIAMSGQRFLPNVFSALESVAKKSGMRYVWTIAEHTPGAESAQGWIGVRNSLNTEWKPIIVYSKGVPSNWPSGFRDFILSQGNDKKYHEWGQPLNVFKTLVDKFTQKKDLVVDPFLGGGTTAVAAHQLGRAAEGFDIDKQQVAVAVERIKE